MSISAGQPVVIVTTHSAGTATPGIPGARGPRGLPGEGSERFTFTQVAPAATWTIVHNLGGYPGFLLFLDDDPHTPVFTDITYPNDDTAVVEWPTPQTGRAES